MYFHPLFVEIFDMCFQNNCCNTDVKHFLLKLTRQIYYRIGDFHRKIFRMKWSVGSSFKCKFISIPFLLNFLTWVLKLTVAKLTSCTLYLSRHARFIILLEISIEEFPEQNDLEHFLRTVSYYLPYIKSLLRKMILRRFLK